MADTITLTSFDAIPPAAKPRRRGRVASQGYDLARTGESDRNHWARADALSANAQNAPDVLNRLRIRSRHETQNNGHVLGMTRQRSNDCIGTGPRLQLSLPLDADASDEAADMLADLAHAVEWKWRLWCDGRGLVDKLHVMDRSETREGEVFGVMIDNEPFEPRTPRLDVRVYEADQCATPGFLSLPTVNAVDGIRFDDAGNAVEFDFLRNHPGDTLGGLGIFSPDAHQTVKASLVFHLLDRDRAGQARGVPAMTPGLGLGAVGRRYTNACLGTAELQASIAGTIETDALPDDDDDEENGVGVKAMQQIPFAHTLLMTLPGGAKANPFPSTANAQNHRDFRADVNTEVGRGINASRNIATGSSAEYNYSSGKLDWLPWQNSIRIRRDRFRRVMLDRLFREWVREALAIAGYLPDGLPDFSEWRWRWQWDGFPSIDPVKDATAHEIELRSGQTTLDAVCAERGRDWEELLEQRAREAKKAKRLGLSIPGLSPAPAAPANPMQPANPPAVDDKADDTANDDGAEAEDEGDEEGADDE